MKLSSINEQAESATLVKSILITEGILGDLMAAGATRLQAKLAQNNSILDDHPGMQKLVDSAGKMKHSLLDTSEREVGIWWAKLLQEFGYTGSEAGQIAKRIVSNLDDEIDRSGENAEERLKELEQKQKEKAGLKQLRKVYGKNIPNTRHARERMQELGVESYLRHLDNTIMEAGFSDILGQALDMLTPRKRAIAGAKMIRASNNIRIASMAVQMLAREHGDRLGQDEEPVDAEIVDDEGLQKARVAAANAEYEQKRVDPKYEDMLASDPESAYYYAKDVLKGEWDGPHAAKAVKTLKGSKEWGSKYADLANEAGDAEWSDWTDEDDKKHGIS